ncbi:MAG: hypothetical protein K0B14_04300 [Anaerolineaceae bacterium]|nr:hypothetical protein [Anaerolineaceae bacterium]
MFNPLNNIETSWKISNMDEAHFNNMGTWATPKKQNLVDLCLFGSCKFFKLLAKFLETRYELRYQVRQHKYSRP